jgi:hypothetical protein
MIETQQKYIFVLPYPLTKGFTIMAELDKLPLKRGIYDITCLHFIP